MLDMRDYGTVPSNDQVGWEHKTSQYGSTAHKYQKSDISPVVDNSIRLSVPVLDNG